MAKAKRDTARRSVKRRAVAALSPPADRTLMVELLTEMYHIVLDAAAEIGVPAKDRHRAMKLAEKDPSRTRPSKRTMRTNYGIAVLLNRWRNDRQYRTPDGTPRVLSIRGKGATFETLARKFVPQLSVNQLADMICENAEVTRLKGKKIALVGSPVMMSPKTPEITLASLILRLRRLTGTIVHNASIAPKINPAGRFERIVTGRLSDREFREFAQSVRQPMQDLCDRVDAGIGQPTPSRRARAKRKTCGIGLYLFRDDDDIIG
jgi:hypothetical protein